MVDEAVAPVDLELLAAAAGEAMGPHVRVVLHDRLPGSERAFVVRATASDGSGERGVVLKLALKAGESGVREVAALRLLRRSGAPGVVPLLGVGEELPVLVLGDLGTGPTLADRLLGTDAGAATGALVDWASAVGRLQAHTADAAEAYMRALTEGSPQGAPAVDDSLGAIEEAVVVLQRELPRLGAHFHGAAVEELRAIGARLARPEAPRGLVPGDTCPDNAVLAERRMVGTPDGVSLLDFEGASHRHVAYEAAYLAMPWPSCWCSWRLPDDATAAALAAWRDAVAPAMPDGYTDEDLDADLDAAVLAWTAVSVSWLLPSALEDDPGPRDPRRAGQVPSRRALLQHRSQVAASRAGATWPALARWAEELHDRATAAWGARPLALAPAYR